MGWVGVWGVPEIYGIKDFWGKFYGIKDFLGKNVRFTELKCLAPQALQKRSSVEPAGTGVLF